jgi:hypothetical protein
MTDSEPAPPLARAAAPGSWPSLAPQAFYGLAGEVVRIMEPHSEADPVADRIRESLDTAGPEGMTKTEIRNLSSVTQAPNASIRLCDRSDIRHHSVLCRLLSILH